MAGDSWCCGRVLGDKLCNLGWVSGSCRDGPLVGIWGWDGMYKVLKLFKIITAFVVTKENAVLYENSHRRYDISLQ